MRWRRLAATALAAWALAVLGACGLGKDGLGLAGTMDAGALEATDAPTASDAATGGKDSSVPGDSAAGADTGQRPDGSALLDGGVSADVTVHDAAPDAPATTYPSTCAEADAGAGQLVTLYVGGDPSRPWQAVCAAGGTYLRLSSASNVSSYPSGGCAGGPSAPVTTTWTMLRIDPVTLRVDTSDLTGSTSTGDTHEVSGNGGYVHDYLHMPYGAGRSCDDRAHSTPFATIDLTGTAFAVASGQTWHLQGYSPTNGGHVPYGGASAPSGKVIDLTVGGYPGGISPCDDYYQTSGGACLQLAYSP